MRELRKAQASQQCVLQCEVQSRVHKQKKIRGDPMMMDGLDHPKTLDLASRLNASIPQVIGHLELLWAFTAQKTPRGNIGNGQTAL